MINLKNDATFKAAVNIPVNGKKEPIKVEVEFRALMRKRVMSLLILTGLGDAGRIKRLIEYIKLCWRLKKIADVVDMLDEVLICWEGIDPGYSRDTLKSLITEYPGAHQAIFIAFLNGWHEERIKN